MLKLFLKLSCFLLLIFFIQFLIGYAGRGTLGNIVKIEEFIKSEIDGLFFIDSTNKSYDENEKEKTPIFGFLEEKLPGVSFSLIENGGYNMDLFYLFVRYVMNEGRKPKFIIFPVNLIFFNVEWDKNPSFQFKKEKVILSNNNNIFVQTFYKPLSLFKTFKDEDYGIVTYNEYLNSPVFNGNVYAGTVRDFVGKEYEKITDQRIKNKLIFQYMYGLNKDNKKFKSMMRIVEILKNTAVAALFYVTPIDYQTGEKHLGTVFSDRIAENVDIMKSYLSENGMPVIDLSRSLETNHFYHHLYPREHLRTYGRKFVADRISKKLIEMLNKKELSLTH